MHTNQFEELSCTSVSDQINLGQVHNSGIRKSLVFSLCRFSCYKDSAMLLCRAVQTGDMFLRLRSFAVMPPM